MKDRFDLSGEIRFRITHENATTPSGFYGDKEPSKRMSDTNSTGFPLRIRLNAHAEAVPDLVDVYARLTMNKRWGAYSISLGDPFDQPIVDITAAQGGQVLERIPEEVRARREPGIGQDVVDFQHL